jgi:hypothetical protein
MRAGSSRTFCRYFGPEGDDLVALGEQQLEIRSRSAGSGVYSASRYARGVTAGVGNRVLCLARGAEPRRHDGHDEDCEHCAQDSPVLISITGTGSPVVDERDVVPVQGVQDQLHTD